MKKTGYLYLFVVSLFTIVSIVIITAQHAMAKDGVIVGGENGTKWCCSGGVKGSDCVKRRLLNSPQG
jgi:hypothetical protein